MRLASQVWRRYGRMISTGSSSGDFGGKVARREETGAASGLLFHWGIRWGIRQPPLRSRPKKICQSRSLSEMAGVVGFEPTVRGTKNRCLTTWLHPNGVRVINADVGRVQALNRENDKVFAFGFMGEKSGFCLRRFRHRCVAVISLLHREKCPWFRCLIHLLPV